MIEKVHTIEALTSHMKINILKWVKRNREHSSSSACNHTVINEFIPRVPIIKKAQLFYVELKACKKMWMRYGRSKKVYLYNLCESHFSFFHFLGFFFCHGADNRIVSTFFYKLTHEMKKILRVLQESIKWSGKNLEILYILLPTS